ncbi:MAG TPA: hypothetical protein VFH47_08620, partial [Candidatus Thermoplasmatota archaeon]|nr:hypothetical protein [Candidatus Thermoplasmatota archaeon]
MPVRGPVVAMVFLLLAAGAAAALPAPRVYFLRDAPEGPALPGQLHLSGPPPLYIPPTDPMAYPGGPLKYATDVAANVSKQSAGTRLILPGQDSVYPAQFITANATDNVGRIYGPIIAFLVLPKTPLVQNANLSIELVALEGGTAPLMQDAKATVLASAQVVVDGGNGTMPDPTSFVPPNATNPQAAAGHVAAQLLLYGITKLAEGQYL